MPKKIDNLNLTTIKAKEVIPKALKKPINSIIRVLEQP